MTLLQKISGRIFRILVALDIFLFAVATLGGAKRNETLSAAVWELELNGKWQGKMLRPLIDWIVSPLQKNHCRSAWLVEQHHPGLFDNQE